MTSPAGDGPAKGLFLPRAGEGSSLQKKVAGLEEPSETPKKRPESDKIAYLPRAVAFSTQGSRPRPASKEDGGHVPYATTDEGTRPREKRTGGGTARTKGGVG